MESATTGHITHAHITDYTTRTTICWPAGYPLLNRSSRRRHFFGFLECLDPIDRTKIELLNSLTFLKIIRF